MDELLRYKNENSSLGVRTDICVCFTIIFWNLYIRCKVFENRAQKAKEKQRESQDYAIHSDDMQKLYPRCNLYQIPFESASCCICLHDFSAQRIGRIVPCVHAFHEECIDSWILCENECPICMRSLPEHRRRLSTITSLADNQQITPRGSYSIR